MRIIRNNITCFIALCSVLVSFHLTKAVSAISNPIVSEHISQALQKANTGKLPEAIDDLYELGRVHPENNRIFFDLAVLLLRDAQYEQALKVINRFPLELIPDYLLEEAIRAYRDATLFTQALSFSAEYRRRNPDSFDAHALEVLVKSDAGLRQESVQQAKLLTDSWPGKYQAWNVSGYVHERAENYLLALRAYQQSLRLVPGNPEAERRQVVALEKLGATSLAAELARKRVDVLSDDERNRVLTSDAAKTIAQAQLEPTEQLRHVVNQKGLGRIDSLLEDQQPGTPALTDDYRLRLRFDRIVGWRDRKMMQEVIEEYEALLEVVSSIPGYVKQAAADAYLYLEFPNQAVELYESLVIAQPDNAGVKIGLFFSLVECERIEEAHKRALEWEQESPTWIRPEGLPGSVPNPEKTSISELVNLSLYFADQLPEAQERLESMVRIAPNMSSLRTTLGDLYKSRGWIEKAVEQYELALALNPGNLSALGGLAAVSLIRNEHTEARKIVTSLLQKHPGSKSLRNFKDELDVVESWDIAIESGYGESDGETFGSESSFFDGRLYSPILYNNIRLYGDYRHQTATFIEGRENLNHYGLGALYRNANLDAEFEIGYTDATVEGGTAAGRVGWRFDDYLRFGAEAELYSRQTPLRAIKNGINADLVSVNGGYRFSESMDWRWQLGYMNFSDGNRKTDGHTGLFKRIYSYHRFVLDSDVALYASHGTLKDTPYYNPELQISMPFTLKTHYMIWRNYRKSFWNRLTFEAGPIYQKDYGTDLNWSINYEHIWRALPEWELLYGITYASRVYDGDRESSWFLTFSIQ